MQSSFYVSGFLYNTLTQQILLYQKTDSALPWSLFGEENKKLTNPAKVFQTIIKKNLSIKINIDEVYPVYDYFHDGFGKNHYIFYAEVSRKVTEIKAKKGNTIAWFHFKQLYKSVLTQQTRQDILIGQRVINAVVRSLEAPPKNPSLINER